MIYLWSGALLIWKVFWMDPKLRIYHGFVDHLPSSFRIFLLIFFQNFFIWKFFLFLYLKIPFLKKNIYKRFFFLILFLENFFPLQNISFLEFFFFAIFFFFWKISLLKKLFTKDYFFENFSFLQKDFSSFLEFHFFSFFTFSFRSNQTKIKCMCLGKAFNVWVRPLMLKGQDQ